MCMGWIKKVVHRDWMLRWVSANLMQSLKESLKTAWSRRTFPIGIESEKDDGSIFTKLFCDFRHACLLTQTLMASMPMFVAFTADDKAW